MLGVPAVLLHFRLKWQVRLLHLCDTVTLPAVGRFFRFLVLKLHCHTYAVVLRPSLVAMNRVNLCSSVKNL